MPPTAPYVAAIPRANIPPNIRAEPLLLDFCDEKNVTVIGIIGKTQGVRQSNRPITIPSGTISNQFSDSSARLTKPSNPEP